MYIYIYMHVFMCVYVCTCSCLYIYIYMYLYMCLYVFGPRDRGSIPGRVMPKAQNMALDSAFLNTHHYQVQIKGEVGQCRERNSAFSDTSAK